MTNRTRRLFFLAVTVVVLIAISSFLCRNCPSVGFALTRKARNLHRLKNRTSIPAESDFDKTVSRNALLVGGDDSVRWSTQHAARIEAYVVDVANARPEATNCFLPCRRDVHITVATRKDAPQNEQIVVEVTPNLRDLAAKQGQDWSESSLRAQLLGHWCELEGWLYFDEGHADQSENTAPHNPTNWRATAWELHPVTSFRIIK